MCPRLSAPTSTHHAIATRNQPGKMSPQNQEDCIDIGEQEHGHVEVELLLASVSPSQPRSVVWRKSTLLIAVLQPGLLLTLPIPIRLSSMTAYGCLLATSSVGQNYARPSRRGRARKSRKLDVEDVNTHKVYRQENCGNMNW